MVWQQKLISVWLLCRDEAHRTAAAQCTSNARCRHSQTAEEHCNAKSANWGTSAARKALLGRTPWHSAAGQDIQMLPNVAKDLVMVSRAGI